MPTETPRVYFGFRSPYSRLGLHIVKNAGISCTVIPFTGPPEGIAFADPTQNPAKLAYYRLDVVRMTMRMGLSIGLPDPFDVDFSPANNAAVAAAQDGCALEYALAVSDARWGAGKNISDLAVLRDAATHINWDIAKVDAAQSDQNIQNALAENRTLIESDQVFGVPFAVNGASKYWGHDRFDLFVEESNAFSAR